MTISGANREKYDSKDNAVEKLEEFYDDLLEKADIQREHRGITSVISHALHIGISRHIKILFEEYSNIFNFVMKRPVINLKFQQYLIYAKSEDIRYLTMLRENNLKDLREWYDSMDFISSSITEINVNISSSAEQMDIVIEEVLQKIDGLFCVNETVDVLSAIKLAFSSVIT